MAQYEQPVNLVKDGEAPDNTRIEEQFMHKYMELRPEALKKSSKKTLEDANTGADDSENNNQGESNMIKEKFIKNP